MDGLGLPPPAIIGAAAGVVLDDAAVLAIHALSRVVWLRARPETLRARIGAGVGRREEATDALWLARQAESRERLYADLADLVIDVDQLSPANIVDHIIGWLGTSA